MMNSDDVFFCSDNADGQPCVLNIRTIHRTARWARSRASFGRRVRRHTAINQFAARLVPFETRTDRADVIDELDRRLHPLLTRLWVRAALECREDEARGQLIFTTHDTNLLDLGFAAARRDLVRRKGRREARRIWRLWPSGRCGPIWKSSAATSTDGFGAIPFLGEAEALLCAPSANSQDTGPARNKGRRGELNFGTDATPESCCRAPRTGVMR